jgi:hypothetical protein
MKIKVATDSSSFGVGFELREPFGFGFDDNLSNWFRFFEPKKAFVKDFAIFVSKFFREVRISQH